MIELELPPVFGEALRAALVEHVDAAVAPAARRRRLLWIVLSVVAGLGILGGAGAATAQILSHPGGTEVVIVGDAVTASGSGDATIELGEPPAGATHVQIEFVCITAGRFAVNGGGEIHCTGGNAGGDDRSHTSTGSTALKPGQHSITVATTPNAEWRLRATYTTETITDWATNAAGDSYGASNQHGDPDLILVMTLDRKTGYVYKSDLAKVDGSQVKNPDEAVAWTKAHKGTYTDVPAYASDGTTQVGVFRVGDWDGVPFVP